MEDTVSSAEFLSNSFDLTMGESILIWFDRLSKCSHPGNLVLLGFLLWWGI